MKMKMKIKVKAETVTLVLVNLAGIMESADEALLPGVYKEVGEALHTDPTGLGSLTLFRSIVQSSCYPLAAYLALRHNRAHVSRRFPLGRCHLLCCHLLHLLPGITHFFKFLAFVQICNLFFLNCILCYCIFFQTCRSIYQSSICWFSFLLAHFFATYRSFLFDQDFFLWKVPCFT